MLLRKRWWLRGEYTGAVVVRDQAKGAEPVSKAVKITVESPRAAADEFTFWVTRSNPFATIETQIVQVPLQMPASTCLPGLQSGGRVSAVTRKAGGSGLVSSGLEGTISNGACMSGDVGYLPLKVRQLSDAGTSSGDVYPAAYSDAPKFKLNVNVQDHWVCPVIVAGLGVTLAFLARRYLGVMRQLLGLRRDEAALSALLNASNTRFDQAAGAQAWAATTIDANDLTSQRSKLLSLVQSLGRSPATVLDDSNANWKEATALLDLLQKQIQEFGLLGPDLSLLAQSLGNAAAGRAATQARLAHVHAGAPAYQALAQPLLQPQTLPVATIEATRKKADDLRQFVDSWQQMNQRISQAYDRLLAVPAATKTANPNPARDAGSGALNAWQALWVTKTAADIDGIASGTDLKNLEQNVWILEQAAAVPAAAMAAAPGAPALVFAGARPARAGLSAASGRARARDYQDLISFGDTLGLIFAWIIAIITGLNTYYFGKPFGTVGDYGLLFVWAAGTKATLDILTAVADKLVSAGATAKAA